MAPRRALSIMLRVLALMPLTVVSFTPSGGAAPIRSGQGDFVYEYKPELLQVPPSPLSGGPNVLNGHAVAVDATGNIFFTFQPSNVAADTQVLVKWKPDGTGGVLLGGKGPGGLSGGVPHGLELEHDAEKKQDFLYHANNAAMLYKTTTTGDVIWMKNLSEWKKTKKHFWPCKPTDATVVGDTVYVADGYGTSWIHLFDKQNGTYLSSFGGPGKSVCGSGEIPHAAQHLRGPTVSGAAAGDRPQ